MIFDPRSNTLILETSALFGIPWSWTVDRAPKNARTENIFCYSGYKFKEKSRNELLSSKGSEKNSSSSIPSLLAENGAINPLFQVTLSLTATSACLQILNPSLCLPFSAMSLSAALFYAFLQVPTLVRS